MGLNQTSVTRLMSCHPSLIRLVSKAAGEWNIQVAFGYRGEEDQNKAYAEGKSKLKYPESKHNQRPSRAVDIYPKNSNGEIDWDNIRLFYAFGGYIMGLCAAMDIDVTWGADWDCDWDFKDQRLADLGHFELAE